MVQRASLFPKKKKKKKFSAHLFDRIVSRKLTSSVTEKISVSLSIHFTDSRKLTSEREEGECECEALLFIFFPIFTNLYFNFQESDRESIRSEKVQKVEQQEGGKG